MSGGQVLSCLVVVALLAILTGLAAQGAGSGGSHVLAGMRAGPIPSVYSLRSPILIRGNGEFNATNGVTGGNGTPGDPYVIDGWEISASAAHGIDIRNTTAAFVIRNVFAHSGRASFHAGVYLENVSVGSVETVELLDDHTGVYISQSRNVEVLRSSLSGNVFGVWLQDSTNVGVRDSTIGPGIAGLRLRRVIDARLINNTIFRMNDWGIDGVWVARVTVEGNTVMNSTQGVYLEGAFDSIVRMNRVVHQTLGPGVMGFVASNLTIADNNLSWNSGIGLGVDFAQFSRIASNEVSNNRIGGIWLDTPSWTNISGNRVLSNNGVALKLLHPTDLTIAGNILVGGGVFIDGDVPSDFLHTVDSTNTVNGLPLLYLKQCRDVTLDSVAMGQLIAASCSNLRVTNVSVRNADVGIEAGFVENLTIADSNLSSNRLGGTRIVNGTHIILSNNDIHGSEMASIVAAPASDVTIVDSRITDGGSVYVSLGRRLIFLNNKIERTDGALDIGQFSELRISGNSLVDNWRGLRMDMVRNVTVTNNNLIGNRNGIFATYSMNVSVHHNRIVGGVYPAADDYSTGVRWDDGYPSGGNYWSRYGGWDDCSGPNQDVCTGPDGLGDTPFPIDENSADHYPRVEAWTPNVPPIARAIVDRTVAVVGDLYSFNGSESIDPDGSIVSFAWDFGDGTAGVGMLATYAYGRPGTYSVRLTVGDNRHGTGNVSLSITVRPILVVTLSATPEHGLVPLTVTVTSLPSGGVPPYEFLWDFGDATLNSFQNGSHIYPNPGPYPVTVSVTDSQGRLATRTVQVVVDPRTSLLQPWHAVQVILGLVVAIVILACAVVFMLCVRKRTRDSKVIR